jgi:hypothetical protein
MSSADSQSLGYLKTGETAGVIGLPIILAIADVVAKRRFVAAVSLPETRLRAVVVRGTPLAP